MAKSITFFMLVTNNDCMFGNFGIKSFAKIYNKLESTQKPLFKLFIYLNNLSEKNKAAYVQKWSAFPFTIIFDNKNKIESLSLIPGEKIQSPEGIFRIRDSDNENYDELWTSELDKFDTDYIATVDADFEILNPDFYFYLLDQLLDPVCIAASTSYTETVYCYDSYSSRNLFLHERNHTWFCIYKKEAFQLSKRSHFYYEKKTTDNEVYAYDSAAYFQEELRSNVNRKLVYLPWNYETSFIHYGAGSKNKSINSYNVWFYRLILILTNTGIIHGATGNKFIRYFNKATKKVANMLFKHKLKSLRTERSTYA